MLCRLGIKYHAQLYYMIDNILLEVHSTHKDGGRDLSSVTYMFMDKIIFQGFPNTVIQKKKKKNECNKNLLSMI